MRFPRPSFSISADVEAAVREVLQPLPVAPKDAPPRYEEVAQDPPAYEEAVTNRNNPASASLWNHGEWQNKETKKLKHRDFVIQL